MRILGTILLMTLILFAAINSAKAEVQFVYVGGPIVTKILKIPAQQQNNEKIEYVEIVLKHYINGENYFYVFKPNLDNGQCIEGAYIQFWCEPIKLAFNKDLQVDKDGKSLTFGYGLTDSLKKFSRMTVCLRLSDRVLHFRLDQKIEEENVVDVHRDEGRAGFGVKKSLYKGAVPAP